MKLKYDWIHYHEILNMGSMQYIKDFSSHYSNVRLDWYKSCTDLTLIRIIMVKEDNMQGKKYRH